jgi:hypothetical protein
MEQTPSRLARNLRNVMLLALPTVLLASCGQTGPSAAPSAAAAACDRSCLEGMVNRYLDALVAHDPSKIPTTADVRFVENDVALPLGSALWKTASGRGTYSHYFSDVAAGQAGFIGTMREHEKGIILVLRLAIAGGRIKEIEQLAIRTGNVDEYERLKPDPLWTEAVPEASRSTRAELTALANRYYSGMQRNDPKGDYSFFHKGCNRIEHGRQTTNMPPSNYGHSDIPNFVTMGCEAQFQTGFLGFVTGIRDRRYPVIDEERQTVLAFAFFDHNGSIRSIPLSTGQIFKVPPYFSTPRTLTISEGFKVIDKKLRLIEATLTESPYGMTSVFNNPPPAPPRAPATESCDQGCTRQLVDTLLAAMIAHDPSKAPLAPRVRYTENGQPLAVGEGMWRTITARGSYNIYLAAASGCDPGFFGSIVETDIPGQLSLRVRQQDGRITEIEALVVRQEIAMLGKLIGTGTLMAPPQVVEFDSTRFTEPVARLTAVVPPNGRVPVAQLRDAATAFAASMYGKAPVPPTAPTCIVRENGGSPGMMRLIADRNKTVQVLAVLTCAPVGIDAGFFAKVGTLREARVLATDETQGLVLMSTVVDHPGDVTTVTLADGTTVPVPPPFTVPNTYLRSMLLKIRDGRIEHVEAITRPVFLGMGDGWDM